MRCSACGDRFEAGFLRHTPGCAFYRMNPATVLFEHPSLVDLEGDMSYWYPDGSFAVRPIPPDRVLVTTAERDRRGGASGQT